MAEGCEGGQKVRKERTEGRTGGEEGEEGIIKSFLLIIFSLWPHFLLLPY